MSVLTVRKAVFNFPSAIRYGWYVPGVARGLTYPAWIAPGTRFNLCAWDTGGAQRVYWTSFNPSATPTVTSPTYTGSLVNVQILAVS